MSIVRVLTLREDKTLEIEPIPKIDSLRSDHRIVGETNLPANQEIVLEDVAGNAVELVAEIDPKEAREVCINVLRSPDNEEHTAVKFYKHGHMSANKDGQKYRKDALTIDPSRSSLLPDVLSRPPEVAPFELEDGETLKLRIFIDKSVVEVFANNRQVLALRVYPGRKDSVGVSVRAQGRDAVLKSLEAWQMKSIYTQD